MFVEQLLDTGEVALNVARGPDHGTPLVLLHGVLRRWNDYAPVLAPLAARWQLNVVDFRGHGRSQRAADGGYLVVDYVRDIAELLRRHFDRPVALYGHSLGAMVALGAAAAAPDRVSALVLEDPPFHTMGERIEGTSFHSQFVGLRGVVRPGRTIDELTADLRELPISFPDKGTTVKFGELRDGAALRYMASCLQHLDPAVLEPIATGRWLDGYDPWSLAAQIQCPSLMLAADLAAGGMLTPDDASRYQRTARGSVTIRFPGVGHLLHWNATEATLRATLTFLESIR